MQENNVTTETPKEMKKSAWVEKLTQMFRENGVENPEHWETLLDANIVHSELDKFVAGYINSTWCHWLGLAGLQFDVDTSNARYTIVETKDVDLWVRLYKENVLPWIKKYNLPSALNF